MKRSLTNPDDRAAVIARLRQLTPDSPRQWGRMTAHQAICHLSDSFRGILGTHPIAPMNMPMGTTLVKWIALRVPLKWPRDLKTPPEVNQEIGGTRPVEFEADRLQLEALVKQLAESRSGDLQPHPIFGRLTDAEWQRWGYLHMDHHLRQFGA